MNTSTSIILVALIIALLSSPSNGLDIRATVEELPEADSFTLFEIVDGALVEIDSSLTPSVTFVKPDDYEVGAFVMRAYNARGYKQSMVFYFDNRPPESIEVIALPGKPVFIEIKVVSP